MFEQALGTGTMLARRRTESRVRLMSELQQEDGSAAQGYGYGGEGVCRGLEVLRGGHIEHARNVTVRVSSGIIKCTPYNSHMV